MKTKCVYALTSDQTDFFLEQLLVSSFSLRHHNPEVHITVVMDSITAGTLDDVRSNINDAVNEIIIVETDDSYSKVERSRYLKTNLRNLVKGDSLFIDCDTVICGALESIDSFDGEIGMVADSNGNLALEDEAILARCSKAGFDGMRGNPYYNSGVVFAKDSQIVHDFYNQWFSNWKHSISKGIKYDQPALCYTNLMMGLPIKELPGIWNCQFKMKGYHLLKDALIMHYFSNNGDNSMTWPLSLFFEEIKRRGTIEGKIKDIIDHPRTLLYSLFSMRTATSLRYVDSPLLYYCFEYPNLFYLIEKLSNVIAFPYRIVGRWK